MPQPADRYDVAVLGLGALGSAAAYWAARRGLRAVGLEQFGFGHDRGASQDYSRVIRRTYASSDYLRFVDAAFEAWSDIEAEAGEQLVFRTGGLDFFPQESLDDPEAYAAAMRAAGVRFELLDGSEVSSRWPVWTIPEPGLRAIFQPDAGLVAASRANAVHRRLAAARGATLIENCAVRSISVEEGGDFILETERGSFRSGAVVIAADAWTNDVLAPFGVRLPLRLLQEQVAYFDASRPELFDMRGFPVWIWHSHPHAYGLPSYGLPGPKVALHGGGPEMGPGERTFEPDADYAATVDAFVEKHLPGAVGPKIEIKTCQYALTPDADFVLDQIPGLAKTAVGLGAGHAFKFASAFGRALVDLAVDGESEYRFPRFAINRFATS